MSEQRYDRLALLDKMASSFSSSEVSELAYSMNIDYEDLAGSNRRAKVRELITYNERRGQIDKLLAALSTMRENIDWYVVAAFERPEQTGESGTEESGKGSSVETGVAGRDSIEEKSGINGPVFVAPTPVEVDTPEESDAKLKVFLSYASQDRPTVRQLYDQLLSDGYDPWLDDVKLLPGMKWNEEIEIAVEESDAVVVCLSKTSVSKEGYIQKEIVAVLDQASRMTEGSIFLIPARLQECPLPRRLRDYQAVDLYLPGGYDRLKQSLELRKRQIFGDK